MRNELDSLIGQTIVAIKLTENKEQIVFVCADKSIGYIADGDCCSYSWIEHLSNIEQLLGAKVTNIEEVDLMPPFDQDYDYIQVYAHKIHTDKGYGLLEYRNRSNGYYGGALSETTFSAEGLKTITEDF